MATCPKDKIINPKSGRCVSRTGSIGRSILSGPIQQPGKKKAACPNDKILNPKSGRCVSRTGSIGRSIIGAIPKSKPQPKPKPRPHPQIKSTNKQSYEEKYPHMNKINYNPSYRPTPITNETVTPTKYSPMDGNYTYDKLKLIPKVNIVTSIQHGNSGSFEYISYTSTLNDLPTLRHTKYASSVTIKIEQMYERNKDLRVKQTVVAPLKRSYYLNPELYHMGQPYFLGFLQPTRGVCYIHAPLNALAFSPLAPQLKTFMNKLGVYGTYSSDLHIATVFNDHVYSTLSIHRNMYSSGYPGSQLIAILKHMRLAKTIHFYDSLSVKLLDFSQTKFVMINFKAERCDTIPNMMEYFKHVYKLKFICGLLDVYGHVVALNTHNGVRYIVDSNNLARYPYDWTKYDGPQLQYVLKLMGHDKLRSISYLAARL